MNQRNNGLNNSMFMQIASLIKAIFCASFVYLLYTFPLSICNSLRANVAYCENPQM